MFDYTPAFCHGDLWAEHILFDPAQEKLTGVIDFESACLGDPAGDWTACGSTTAKGDPDIACPLWRSRQLDFPSSDHAIGKLCSAQRNPVRRALR